jgi:hypothetical protein
MKNKLKTSLLVMAVVSLSVRGILIAQVEGPTQVCPGTSYHYYLNPDWIDNAISSGWVAIGGTVNSSSLTESNITWNANASQRKVAVTATYINITYDDFGFPNYDYFTVDYYLNVATTPSAPVVNPPGYLCQPGNITLSASGAQVGEQYRWYDANQNIISGQTGNQYIPYVSSSTSFFVSIVNSLGCDASALRQINVSVQSVAAPVNFFTYFRCGPGDIELQVDPQIDLVSEPFDRIVAYVRWYSQATGGTYLFQNPISRANPYAVYSANVSASTVYYTSTYNPFTGCESNRVPLSVTVQTIPSISFSQTNFDTCTGETINPSYSSNIGLSTVLVQNTSDSWISGQLQYSYNPTLSHALVNNGSTDGTVQYFLTPSTNGCNGTTQTVSVKVKPRPQFSTALLDKTSCSGSAILINPQTNVASSSFRWVFGVAQGSVTGATNSSGTSFNQNLTNNATIQAVVNYTITATKNGCDGATTTFRVLLDALSNGGSASGSQAVFASQNSGTATLSAGYLGSITKWRYVQNGVTQDIPNQSNSQGYNNILQTTYYKAVVKNGVCNEVESIPALITVEALPTITSSSARVIMGSQITLSSSSSYSSYQWKNELGTIVSNNATFSTNLAGKYSLTVTKAGVVGSATSTQFNLLDQLDGQNTNDIITNTMLVSGTKDIATVRNLGVDKRSQSIQYFDGLGRPIQSVSTQGSPTKNDIVQTIMYDAFGRESKKYLPVFTNTSDGWYKEGLIDAAGNYVNSPSFTNPYGNGLGDKIADDQRPYTETMFEPSPLNRPDKDFGIGQDWYTTNKHVKHDYLVNVHGITAEQERIIAWNVDASGMPVRAAAVMDYVEAGGFYSTGQLNVKSTKDEQGNEVREYVDKEGRTILKKVQAVSGIAQTNIDSHWAMTYYIYDDFGNLVVVLPPEAVKTFQN